MQYIGIDLGSTNIKAAVYDRSLRRLAEESEPVQYERSGAFVEFDAELFVEKLFEMLKRLLLKPGVNAGEIQCLGLTGQAETLVVLDDKDRPLMNAVSWMDERSKDECRELEKQFRPEEYRGVTGQQAVLPTWPATKILWLRKNRPEIYGQAACYMLLKDYVCFRLTDRKAADCSIATFSFYFDIYRKCYWKEMLEMIGVREEQLPPLTEPCRELGGLTEEAAERTGLSRSVRVNIGTLDHFAGMIGTGNVEPGGMSLSTGTVMALAVPVADVNGGKESGLAMHYGFLPDTYVLLPVAESGGVSLEWFLKTCMPGMDYERLNRELEQRPRPNGLIFLPYLVGTNAPEFDEDACGLFYGLRAGSDAYDMAAAVMEGTSFVLRKSCDAIRASGTEIRHITAAGGGARSAVWCQMQADITGIPVDIPCEKEAACLGAAMIAAAGEGADAEKYRELAALGNRTEKSYVPCEPERYERKYRQFCRLYQSMLETARLL